ncbi:MAG TPA: GAF domain-containing sensor histidine kinase [Actinomycetota bacterium]|nr:GAF domain-containing sensor histidine kinase [Actinomycetota bacterium]
MRQRGWLVRAAEAFMPSWIDGVPFARLTRTLAWIRISVAGAALILVWALPASPAQRVLFIALVVGLYLPFAITHLVLSSRPQGPFARIAVPALDVLIVFAFEAVLPPTRIVALFGYLLLVALYAYVGGRVAGGLVGGAAAVLSELARIIDPRPPAMDLYTLAMFGVVVACMVWLVDAAGRGQRAASRRLAQLHDSLRSVSSSVGLHDMLEAVAASATSSLGALFSAVLMRDTDDLKAGAVQGIEPGSGNEGWTRDAVDTGPSATALATGRTVVVEDLGRDPRFGRWADVGRQLGFSSMIAAPLLMDDRAIGVLNVYFPPGRTIDPGMAELADAYAQQAAAAVVRAVAYERERDAAARLREVDRLKDEFLATVSHELRTPLTSIKGFIYTGIARWAELDDDLRLEILERAAANADRLESLIEQLLDFSRVQAPEPEVHPRPVPIEAAIRSCLAALEPAIGAGRVGVDVAPQLAAQVDPHGLERILMNLLTNAAKFSPPSEPILVEARRQGATVVVTVRDRGPGIPRDEVDRIFEPFYRAGPERSAPGTGIGLAIVRRYVELHGGRVWADSAPGEGAAFSFTLPPAGMTWRPPKAATKIAS